MANAGTDMMSASLTQIYGENLNKNFELKGSQVLIGRTVKAGVRLQCPTVSRRHCILTRCEKGWNVEDCNSQNGTYVNGRKLEPNESYLLKCGDLIFLGPPSEMPQAFCCDISYNPLYYEPTELTETHVEVEEFLISPEKKTPVKETSNALQENRKRKCILKKKFPIETSLEGKQVNSPAIEEILISPDKTPRKDNTNASTSTDYPGNEINEEIVPKKYDVLDLMQVDMAKKDAEISSSPQKKISEKRSSKRIGNKKRTITHNMKDSAEQLRQAAKEVQEKSLSNGWDTSLSQSVKFRPKRKVPSIYQSKEITNSPKNRKKTKIVPNLLSKYKKDEFVYSEQINQISSTADDQVENSQSLLDIQGNDGNHKFCSSSADDVNASSGSHDAYSWQDERKTETELLKSQLAMMSEKIKKLEKSNSLILKDFKNASEENMALNQQLNEQKKLQEELISCEVRAKNEMKEEILNKFEEDLLCNICTELFIKPTVLECTHTFCEYCIKEWKKKKNECPICRHKIENMTRVLTLEHFIDKSLQTLTPEQRDKREELVKERFETERNQRRNAKKSKGRRGIRRIVSSNRRQANNDSIEIVGERNVVLPIALPPLLPLFLNNRNFRLPEALFASDNEDISTLNIYHVSS